MNCHTPKFGSASNILFFVFNVMKISLRVPLIWSSLSASLPLGHCHFHHYHFLYWFDKLAHQVPLALNPESLDACGSANIPTASCFCYSSIDGPFTLHLYSISFSINFFAALSSLSVSSLFWLFIFIKCLMDFIIGGIT